MEEVSILTPGGARSFVVFGAVSCLRRTPANLDRLTAAAALVTWRECSHD
jgi:hypothetical protein